MLSAQIDELRKMADGQATFRDAREVMLKAADTIWQLRDDLQRTNAVLMDVEHDESVAWDRVRKAEAENRRLRELARLLLYGATHDAEPAEGLVWSQKVDVLARKLGIEVEE